MNFAEKLINWRDNNEELQKCQKAINDMIEAKKSFILSSLKSETEKGDIGIYVLHATEFFQTLIDCAQHHYKKTCHASILELLLINTFSLENGITVIKDTMNKNCFYVFFNNGAIDETASVRLIKKWFNSYVLKDFEKKYKDSNNTTARFTSFFEAEYSYFPIINAIDRLKISTKTVKQNNKYSLPYYVTIPEHLNILAKENGLSIERTTGTEFMLRI